MAALINSFTASTALAGKKVVSTRSSVRAVARPRSNMRCEAKWSETMVGDSNPMGPTWDPMGFMNGKDENRLKVCLAAEPCDVHTCSESTDGSIRYLPTRMLAKELS